jgi:hypothetical protein
VQFFRLPALQNCEFQGWESLFMQNILNAAVLPDKYFIAGQDGS